MVPKSYDKALVNQRVALIRPKESVVLKEFIYHLLSSPIVVEYVREKSKTLMQPNLSIKDLALLPVPLPSIAEQQSIINAIEEEMQLVSANKRLIELFEQKIKDKINEVWGITKSTSFKIEQENLSMAAEP